MIKIADKIYIDLDRHPMRKELYTQLTYKNPEFYQKMNLGLSVWNIPKEVRTYNQKQNKLEVLRGEFQKCQPYFYGFQIDVVHPDVPVKIKYQNQDFELDQYQEGAVKAITSMNQGIVHAVTSAGKSLIILKAICELGQRALIVVHRKILMEQFIQDIKKYVKDSSGNPIDFGVIGDGKFSIGDITIALDKTLGKHPELFKGTFGAVFLDECHLAPANTIYSIINNIDARYRFGFSGTLKRKDQKEFLIYSSFGSVIYTIGKDQLLELNRVVPVDIQIMETDTEAEPEEEMSPTKLYQFIEKKLSNDLGRQYQIVEKAHDLSKKGKTMVLSRLVQPCYDMKDRMEYAYPELIGKIGIITGRDTEEALASYNAMKHEDMRVIFATIGCVSTGVSISDLEYMILASPIYNNELLLHQIRGRLMRMAEGKEKGTLYFVYDPYVFPESKLNKFLSIMRK